MILLIEDNPSMVTLIFPLLFNKLFFLPQFLENGQTRGYLIPWKKYLKS